MNVTPDVLKDYVFGELDAAGRREVERAAESDPTIGEELARLQMTQTALFAVRDEEIPRRIAFVSDKVFEPKWWHAWLNSGPRMAFASAALLAAAIVSHGAMQTAAPATPAFDQAQLEQRVSQEVAKAIPAALERIEGQYKLQLANSLKEAEGKYQRLRQDDILAMEAAYSLWQQKQASRQVANAYYSRGSEQ